jgi:hypothetical protein
MTNTDKKTKQFNREQIQHCLAIIDQLKPSGLSTQEFAKTHGLTYGQIRAWQSQAPRWRAKLTEDATTSPARRKLATPTRFVQVKVLEVDTARVLPSIRIDCSQGARSVVLHWPLEASVQCAQWLKAYLA